MDGMQFDYEPASNMVDETNDLTVYVVNSQNNVIFLLITLTFFVVVLNCKSAGEVHTSEPVIGKQQPWEVELSEINPQCSWYRTRLMRFSSASTSFNI